MRCDSSAVRTLTAHTSSEARNPESQKPAACARDDKRDRPQLFTHLNPRNLYNLWIPLWPSRCWPRSSSLNKCRRVSKSGYPSKPLGSHPGLRACAPKWGWASIRFPDHEFVNELIAQDARGPAISPAYLALGELSFD